MTYTTDTPAGSDAVPIGNRAVLLPSKALPELDSVGGRAFAANFKNGETSSDLFAILCGKNLPPRLDVITSMRTVDHPGILRLIDSGVVHLPQDNMQSYAFAYQRPVSSRMKQSIDEPHEVMSEDFINHYFVTPMISTMVELLHTGIVHNALRPTNIFWRIGGTTVPQLGECLSAPAGYGQPVLFEPTERAMCAAIARGQGSHVDDCYAFGVTLALLIFGSNPLQGMDDAAIVRTKIEKGTFAALIGNRRVSPSHIELLRGLLADDGRQRWTGAELEQWMNGRRSTPKNTDAGKRASRGFEFCGQSYWQTRPLAVAFSTHVNDAAQVIENGSLDKWLRRAMGDESRANSLVEAQHTLKQSGKTANFEEQLVSRTCIALDPAAPISYRGLTVMPMGIASLLVDSLLNGQNVQVISEIIGSQLVSVWVEMQQDGKTEALPLGQQLERMKGLIEKSALGNGIERVAYELNSGLQCLSPILKGQFVSSAKQLLPALERIAASGERPSEPMDRHIAAFLVVRDRRSDAIFDGMLAPATSPRRGLAFLSLFNDLQEKHGPEALPYLAQWLLPLLEPATQRFLGKTAKEKVKAQVKEAVTRGNLAMLARLIDDPRRIERDQQEFMAARMLYLNIMKEVATLENRLAHREEVVRSTGKPMAATISTFIAIILVFAAVLRAAWKAIN